MSMHFRYLIDWIKGEQMKRDREINKLIAERDMLSQVLIRVEVQEAKEQRLMDKQEPQQ